MKAFAKRACLLSVLLLAACNEVPIEQSPIELPENVHSEQGSEQMPAPEQSTQKQTAGVTTSAPQTEAPKQTEAATTAPPATGEPTPASGIVTPGEKGYTYPEMEEDLAMLQETYGEHFTYESIGKSVDGREIFNSATHAKLSDREIRKNRLRFPKRFGEKFPLCSRRMKLGLRRSRRAAQMRSRRKSWTKSFPDILSKKPLRFLKKTRRKNPCAPLCPRRKNFAATRGTWR